MTPQQPLIELCRSALENNGGPIGHEDGYVMVTREDFDVLAAAVKEYDSQSVKGTQPTTSLSDEVVTATELVAFALYGASNQAWNDASDMTRQLYRAIARNAIAASGLPAENDRLREQNDMKDRHISMLLGQVYVPGTWRCAKCELVMQSSVMSARSGEMHANTEPHTCPNCDVPMWRISERDQRKEAMQQLEKQFDELSTLRTQLANAQRALERIHGMAERPVCICGVPTGTGAIKACAATALAYTGTETDARGD